MTQVRIFYGDECEEVEKQINKFLADHPCTNVRFMQMVGEASHNYAVLVAWEEE